MLESLLTPKPEARLAVVLACDAPFFPLAKALVLSARAPLQYLQRKWPKTELVLMDIGCEAQQRAWFESQGVIVHAFSSRDFAPTAELEIEFNYQQGQLLRPFLPQLLPEYSDIIWVDADIWLQRRDCLEVFAAAMQAQPEQMAICSSFDFSSALVHDLKSEYHLQHYLNLFWKLYSESFSLHHAERFKGRGLFNCGFFGLTANSPLWESWQKLALFAFQRRYTQDYHRFMFEQSALNVALYEAEGYTLIDPIYNYQCHAAHPLRLDGEADREGLYQNAFPPRLLGAVHLSRFRDCGRRYIQAGYLYQQGQYLEAHERQALLELCK